MQDFTGVPAIVDLAAMRDAMEELGGDPTAINPLVPVELVIDHSIQVDSFAERLAFQKNAEREYERNHERYAFLRWGQGAFDNFSVVPPNTGICHQVNLEYLSRVVESRDGQAFPDTLVGTDSHTTMVNGLGVLGWGVGGIEAEAAMLGQPVSMLLPQVVGFRLENELPEGSTATDLVLTVTEMLRERGVVGKFVEFYGPGLANLALADRATIGNMSPEFGSTCAIFPVDAETLRYMEFSGRPTERLELVEAYAPRAGHVPRRLVGGPRVLRHAWSSTSPPWSPAWPAPSARRTAWRCRPPSSDFLGELADQRNGKTSDHGGNGARQTFPASDPPSSMAGQDEGEDDGQPAHQHEDVDRDEVPHSSAHVKLDGDEFELEDGAVVIAAITSCTNTSNPSVMLGAGLLAKKAVEAGLERKPWVKTSLAPGSKVVTDYLDRAELTEPLSALGFDLVGYGCTTCIGNSGPLQDEISAGIEAEDLTVCSVLSGNRNFEGRIHPEVKMNYLASPPLCVAYALAGRMDLDLYNEPLGQSSDGEDVYLRDIWPSGADVNAAIESAIESDMFRKSYGEVFEGDENWNELEVPEGDRYAWDDESTYVKRPPYFEGMEAERARGLRADHRRPRDRAAGRQRDHRPHLTRGRDQGGHPRRPVPDRERRREARVQLLRLAPRQPRGDDARHLRQRAAAQPARARHRGRLHAQGRRGAASSTTPRWSTPTRACRCACSRARSTARAHRATGPPRARGCWASASRSPRATSASTAPTWWGWACCRCSSPTASRPSRSAWTAARPIDLGRARGRRARAEGHRDARGRGRPDRVRGPRAHRHPERVALLPPRGHPALRAAPAARPRLSADGASATRYGGTAGRRWRLRSGRGWAARTRSRRPAPARCRTARACRRCEVARTNR